MRRALLRRPEGPIKTFPLSGIKDSQPYLHDGRCPTLHDAVEFFNLVLELKQTKPENEDFFFVSERGALNQSGVSDDAFVLGCDPALVTFGA